MAEFGEDFLTTTAADRKVNLKRLVPGSAEREARRKNYTEIYEKALERITKDDPEELKSGSRVEYIITKGDSHTVVSIIKPNEDKTTEDGSTKLEIYTSTDSPGERYSSQKYSIKKTSDDISINILPNDIDRDRKEGLITRRLTLTQKGRSNLIQILDMLPNAQRRYLLTADYEDAINNAVANLDEEIETHLAHPERTADDLLDEFTSGILTKEKFEAEMRKLSNKSTADETE